MERHTATLLRDDEELTDAGDATATASATGAMDDFFSDAPLDAEGAETGKTCNIWDPECEACQ